jgi:hypothetical protein
MTICSGRCNMLLRPGATEDRSLDPYVAEDMASRFTGVVDDQRQCAFSYCKCHERIVAERQSDGVECVRASALRVDLRMRDAIEGRLNPDK